MMIKNYRKRPVVIQAVVFDSVDTVLKFVGMGNVESYDVSEFVMLKTLEGPLKAIPGDYIIRGVRGEFYPCKPDIFLQTYEEVKDE